MAYMLFQSLDLGLQLLKILFHMFYHLFPSVEVPPVITAPAAAAPALVIMARSSVSMMRLVSMMGLMSLAALIIVMHSVSFFISILALTYIVINYRWCCQTVRKVMIRIQMGKDVLKQLLRRFTFLSDSASIIRAY